MIRLLVVLAVVTSAVVAVASAAGAAFPAQIDLPNGFQPEGIAISGDSFYVGSIPTGAVYRGDLRTGAGAILVPAQAERSSIGMKADRGRLFVAGGPTGKAFVYDAETGATIASYTLTTEASFVNDVVVTKDAAWFTDSFRPVLYRVPLGPGGAPGPQSSVETIPLSGDYTHVFGPGVFNLNGIDASPNGKVLVAVQSVTGKLFRISPDGVASEVVLANGENVENGDGILLLGKTLYVVRNVDNEVAQIELSPELATGVVVARITDPGFDVPTTLARHGSRLYAVNARFTTPPTPATPYWVTQLR